MNKKIVKSEAEWRQELTEEEYYVTRQKGTERAFHRRTLRQQGPGRLSLRLLRQ